jgi:hypothetical protein
MSRRRVFVGEEVFADAPPDALFKSFVMIVVSEIGMSSFAVSLSSSPKKSHAPRRYWIDLTTPHL